LSLGCVLQNVYELREEIAVFLKKQKHVFLAEKLSQGNFLANVAYLADIFDYCDSSKLADNMQAQSSH